MFSEHGLLMLLGEKTHVTSAYNCSIFSAPIHTWLSTACNTETHFISFYTVWTRPRCWWRALQSWKRSSWRPTPRLWISITFWSVVLCLSKPCQKSIKLRHLQKVHVNILFMYNIAISIIYWSINRQIRYTFDAETPRWMPRSMLKCLRRSGWSTWSWRRCKNVNDVPLGSAVGNGHVPLQILLLVFWGQLAVVGLSLSR